MLPKGYVFRLPTEAEWEYVLTSGGTEIEGPYSPAGSNGKCPARLHIVSYEDAISRDVNKVLPQDSNSAVHIWGMEAGIKRPNQWGFHDMLGSGGDLTLDTVNSQEARNISYEGHETDPLHFCASDAQRWCKRNTDASWDFYWARARLGKAFVAKNGKSAIHIVIGPDLMKEKGYDKKVPKKR